MPEQCGDGKPVGEAADDRRFRGGAHIAEPGVLGLEEPGGYEDRGGQGQEAGCPALHRVELGRAGQVVGAGGEAGQVEDAKTLGRYDARKKAWV
jgi:hypothetical protein